VVGGVVHTAPPLTPIEEASRNSSEKARAAWNMGLNLHNLWVRINLHRADWTGLNLPTTYSGAIATYFADCMPYWSKVLGLTVHERGGLSASGTDPTRAPVTQVDVALSEAVIRLIMKVKDTAARELAGCRDDVPERAHVGGRAGGRHGGPGVDDPHVANGQYPGMLAPRNPTAFP
jgi:hypothetical protein